MPELELTTETVNNPHRLALSYVEGVMLWPDDPDARRRAADAVVAHYTAANMPEGLPTDRSTLIALATAPRLADLEEQSKARYYEGMFVGYTVCALIDVPQGKTPAKTLTEAKGLALKQLRGVGGRSFDVKMADVIWSRLKPVAHLWAAYLACMARTGDNTFPCRTADLKSFLMRAEMMLIEGSRFRPPRSPVTLLDRATAWTAPALTAPPPVSTVH